MKRGRRKSLKELKLISFNIETIVLEVLNLYCINKDIDRTSVINEAIISYLQKTTE